MQSRIVGTGSYRPTQVLTNADLAQRVDTSDEWIVERTGIRERRIAAPAEQTSDLALHASRAALEGPGIAPAEVEHKIMATQTPDCIFPSTACILPANLCEGAPRSMYRRSAAVVYTLAVADRMVASGMARMRSSLAPKSIRGSSTERPRDCVLFGGAGAVVLVPSRVPGILSAHLHADGRYGDILCVPGTIADGAVVGSPFVKMEGGAVFKFAVKVLADVAHEALAARAVTAAAIDWLVPHQANVRIIDAGEARRAAGR
jgi:3-oxoacyl-[acyl-carrier-protein] synthase-3